MGMLSGMIPRLTGSVPPSRSIGSYAVSHTWARSLVALATDVVTTKPSVVLAARPGSGRIASSSEESVKVFNFIRDSQPLYTVSYIQFVLYKPVFTTRSGSQKLLSCVIFIFLYVGRNILLT